MKVFDMRNLQIVGLQMRKVRFLNLVRPFMTKTALVMDVGNRASGNWILQCKFFLLSFLELVYFLCL